jgi:hypothetical protein
LEKAVQEEREEKIRQKKRKIEEVHEIAKQSKLDNYAELFDGDAEKEAVVLAELDVEDLDEESNRIHNNRIEKGKVEIAKYLMQRKELNQMQLESRDQLVHKGEIFQQQIIRKEKRSIKTTDKKKKKIDGAFYKAGNILHTYLGEIKDQVIGMYNDLTMDYKSERHNLSGRTQDNSEIWAAHTQPQTIEIHFALLRCVKDKLPKGRYAILCSIMDRLGGSMLEMQRKNSRRWRCISAPKAHSGKYHLNNLVFDDSVMIMVPSRNQVRPSMALLFEVFLLKSKDYPYDQVCAWGAFPLVNTNFEINIGKFKVPLLVGPVDDSICRYQEIENMYTTNLDCWLANLYFTIERRDSLAIPDSVKLVLDEETKQRHEKYMLLEEVKEEKDSIEDLKLEFIDMNGMLLIDNYE